MALIVEDGSGLPNADALISLAEADAYHEKIGNSVWVDGDDEAKEQAIRRSTSFLSSSYSWEGARTNGRSQSLAWPRSGVTDADGNAIADDEIPIEVKNACAEVALRELVTPGAMNPDFVPAEAVKSEKVGPLAVEYANPSTSADSQRPVLMLVRDMVAPFLKDGTGNTIVKTLARA